ncbi:MAG: RNA-directed DNA polymerase [Niveispirillum sp.]|nr:RNA-directed DNA polymerase [Niveispirillum sp.]
MLSKTERIEVLLARGYFLKELPPPFTSKKFAGSISDIALEWTAHQTALSATQRRSYPPTSQCARFDMARKGHSRRILSVPNPVSQYYLVDFIAENQDKFEDISGISKISLTPAHIRMDGSRAVSMEKLSVLGEKRIQAYANARAILQTDILSFYHTIYTHSISWALHGKKVAKRNRNKADPAVYGNKIDALMQACQDGQTKGIPVGPDTSRIISEIILCAIEQQIDSRIFSRMIAGYRYVDDFFLCFSSHVDAEAFLSALRDAVQSFDLQLNASKTRILNSTDFNEESWPGDIAQLNISSNAKDQRRDLIRFFTEVIRLSKAWPDESIFSFAVRKTSRRLVRSENWDIYEPFLLRLARENSNCLDSVVKILCTYAAIGYSFGGRIKAFAESMIEEHAPYNHHFEVVWVLWLCRSLSIRLGERATQLVSKVENSLCGCLVLMLRSRGLLTGRGAVSDWTGSVTKEDLFGEHWMLIYESGIRKSWNLPGAVDAVNDDPNFRILRDKKISFFDSSATNVALKLPSIDKLLEERLDTRRSATLPGAVYVESITRREERHYEKLGEDYGVEVASWALPSDLFNIEDSHDIDGPE